MNRIGVTAVLVAAVLLSAGVVRLFVNPPVCAYDASGVNIATSLNLAGCPKKQLMWTAKDYISY